MTDALTGLANRRAMHCELGGAHSRSLRHGDGYALLMADLDHFKQVNDVHGHDVGDQVLKELARRLKMAVRAEDHVARWGGEEFLLLIQGVEKRVALAIAEKLRATVAETPFATSAGALSVTVSIGLALNAHDRHYETVCSRADQALYQAKRNGRNRTEIL
nr:GGDEF domain-containing protein [Methylonatrum kenyense]